MSSCNSTFKNSASVKIVSADTSWSRHTSARWYTTPHTESCLFYVNENVSFIQVLYLVLCKLICLQNVQGRMLNFVETTSWSAAY